LAPIIVSLAPALEMDVEDETARAPEQIDTWMYEPAVM
jgi:hypothetical protein